MLRALCTTVATALLAVALPVTHAELAELSEVKPLDVVPSQGVLADGTCTLFQDGGCDVLNAAAASDEAALLQVVADMELRSKFSSAEKAKAQKQVAEVRPLLELRAESSAADGSSRNTSNTLATSAPANVTTANATAATNATTNVTTANVTEGTVGNTPFARRIVRIINVTLPRPDQNVSQGNVSQGNVSHWNVSQENGTHVVRNHTEVVTDPGGNTIAITETEVVAVASLSAIVSTYLLLFVPLGLMWLRVLVTGQLQEWESALLAVSLTVLSIGGRLVDQSLTLIVNAPIALAAGQSFFGVVAAAVWLFVRPFLPTVNSDTLFEAVQPAVLRTQSMSALSALRRGRSRLPSMSSGPSSPERYGRRPRAFSAPPPPLAERFPSETDAQPEIGAAWPPARPLAERRRTSFSNDSVSDWGGESSSSRAEETLAVMFTALRLWGIASLLWVVKEMLSHGVTQNLRLSERSMLINFSTVFIMGLESSRLLPAESRLQMTFGAQLAIGMVAFGSVLFVINYGGEMTTALAMAIVMVLLYVPCKLTQRWLLVKYSFLTVGVLTLYDMFFLLPVASAVSLSQPSDFFGEWVHWLSDPSIVVMMVLSCVSFVSTHALDLLMVRRSSGTACMVSHSVANSVELFLGALFFNDASEAKNSFALVGVAIAFLAGIWFSLEMRNANPSMKEPEAA